MGHGVALDHVLVDQQGLALDDNVLDTASEAGIRLEAGQPVGLGMATDEEAVRGVRGGDSGYTDARLGEHVIHRERDHVLGFHR